MNSELSIFQFESKEVRVVLINDEPWFVAKDVCDILEIKNVGDALSRLDSDEKQELTGQQVIGLTDNLSITRLSVVSESGMYALVLSSRKPEAKPFRKWVTAEVLPQIRKTGGYSIQSATTPQLPSYIVAQETANAIAVIQEKLALTQPRLTQFLIEAAMNDINRMMTLPPATPVEEQLMTCEAWGNENGFKVTKENRSQLGKFVAKQWRLEMGSEPIAQKQECGGAMRDIKVYPVSFLIQKVPVFFS